MRQIILLLLLLNSIDLAGQPTVTEFPDIDRSLIRLWTGSFDPLYEDCIEEIKYLKETWEYTKCVLPERPSEHFLFDEFLVDVDYYIETIQSACAQSKKLNVRKYSYHLLHEFRNMRECTGRRIYILDEYIELYDVYEELHETIYDPMFGLLEWFEFKGLVEGFREKLDRINAFEEDENLEMKLYRNSDEYKFYLGNLESCFLNFEQSLESGYQSDFELPCDELGQSMRAIILGYSDMCMLHDL